MIDLIARLAFLRQKYDALRMFALIDGVQYRIHRGQYMERRLGCYSLFDGTPDAPLGHAGPWLIDVETADAAFIADLAALERETAALSWLLSVQSLEGLFQLLQLKLDAELPDGRMALLRFWDPRVLVGLADVMTWDQQKEFFGHILEWHLLSHGERVCIGRPHVSA